MYKLGSALLLTTMIISFLLAIAFIPLAINEFYDKDFMKKYVEFVWGNILEPINDVVEELLEKWKKL